MLYEVITPFLAGAGEDVEAGVESAGGQGDVDVVGIGGDSRNQPAGAQDAGRDQCLIVGGITAHVQNPLLAEPIAKLGGLLDHHEGERFGLELAADEVADAAVAADVV